MPRRAVTKFQIVAPAQLMLAPLFRATIGNSTPPTAGSMVGMFSCRTANRNSPRHKLLADHLEDRAQIVVVAAFLEYPIDEVDHPGTFRSCEILTISREV